MARSIHRSNAGTALADAPYRDSPETPDRAGTGIKVPIFETQRQACAFLEQGGDIRNHKARAARAAREAGPATPNDFRPAQRWANSSDQPVPKPAEWPWFRSTNDRLKPDPG